MTVTAPTGPDTRVRKILPLRDLGVAPENMRFGQPPDEEIPQLAETILAAGLLQPLTVRPGRRREKPAMALDGRRRLLALDRLLTAGAIDDGYPVEVFEETDPARQAAAVLLTNSAVPVHVADVIGSIGKMLKAKLTVPVIARALGYSEVEIKRLAALSGLPPKALAALKQGRLTLSQARLLARLPDRELQAELAAAALAGLGFQGWRVCERLESGRVTALDRRFDLVGAERYAEAGGRVEADLFGELADQLLDPEILQSLWTARVREAAAALEAEGLAVHVSADGDAELDDGLEPLGYVYANALSEEALRTYEAAHVASRTTCLEVRAADLAGDEGAGLLAAMLRSRLAMERAGQPGRTIKAVVLWPAGRLGVDSRFYGEPQPETEAETDGGVPVGIGPVSAYRSSEFKVDVPARAVDVEGVGHALHETRTDMAARGLIRALADDPGAALVALTARLFTVLVLETARSTEDAALTVTARPYTRPKHGAVEALDGEVRRRLAERRAAWKASGVRPIPWVAELPHGERMALLAELVALSLDLREPKTTSLRPSAWADAAEIAALACADITAYWTPDEPFLKAHAKTQLLAMLAAMDLDDARAKALKKDELVAFVAERAAERGWAPPEVNWSRAEVDDSAEPDGLSEEVGAEEVRRAGEDGVDGGAALRLRPVVVATPKAGPDPAVPPPPAEIAEAA